MVPISPFHFEQLYSIHSSNFGFSLLLALVIRVEGFSKGSTVFLNPQKRGNTLNFDSIDEKGHFCLKKSAPKWRSLVGDFY